MYFGVRAYAPSSVVRATLATRDHLTQDDVVTFFVSTFPETRQAYAFAVNPFGVQLDGVLTEGTRGSEGQSRFGELTGGRELVDPSPDFVFHSKGRLTDFGFEIEVEIPFKSIRFPAKPTQDWTLHVERTHRASGAVSSWVPAKRAAASYLGQAAPLSGLRDLRRGPVLDITPVVTSTVIGGPAGLDAWDYRGGRPEFGADVRWGATTDLTLSATVRPDFSQVESDAGQVQYDPRSALFFPEKRAFFLEGSELFETPSNLVYTRQIIQPIVATKLAGNFSGMGLGLLAAVDDRVGSRTGEDHPVHGIARIVKSLGPGARLGGLYTGRFDGSDRNHVLGVDGRITIAGRATLDLLGAGSFTRESLARTDAAMWTTAFNVNGRRLSFRYTFDGIGERFAAGSGFIGRAGIVNLRTANQVTFYGPKRSLIERVSLDFTPFLTWRYADFVAGRGLQDDKWHINSNWRFRGGWTAQASFVYERAAARKINSLRVDWLVAFQPNPGTVMFAGYGASHQNDAAVARSSFRRIADGFFVKLSYLFRL